MKASVIASFYFSLNGLENHVICIPKIKKHARNCALIIQKKEKLCACVYMRAYV